MQKKANCLISDGPMDGQTEKASYRSASHLKRKLREFSAEAVLNVYYHSLAKL